MSTRALYSFSEDEHTPAEGIINIYKHHDGYPSGAAETLTEALKYAWPEPRFEADEFAAAFCAAGKVGTAGERTTRKKYKLKTSGGGVRVFPNGQPQEVATNHCSDIEFRYDIYFDHNFQKIMVAAFAVSVPWNTGGDDESEYTQKWLFTCPLAQMKKTVAAIDKAKEAEQQELLR